MCAEVEHRRRLHRDQGSKVTLLQAPGQAGVSSVVLRWGKMQDPFENKAI